MGIKTLLFAAFVAGCVLGAAWLPVLGVLGYVGIYSIGPQRQWWHAPLSRFAPRYSLLLVTVTALGMALNWSRLRCWRRFFANQEKLLLLFAAVIWLGVVLGGGAAARYAKIDPPEIKFLKVMVFLLMVSHVVTDTKKLDWLLWIMIAGVLILGMQAYDTPRRAFVSGRLDTIGGPDFAEANFLAAYLAAMLPLIGVQLLHSRWPGKALCAMAGVFGTNAIVLTRSRGAVVGLAVGGLVAAMLSPRKHRTKVTVGLVVFGLGVVYLADPQFIQRAGTITRSEGERDSSTQSRFVVWRAAGRMIQDHPQGVGPGNFYKNVGRYNRDLAGMAAHNTYVHIAAELGLQGIAVFGILIISLFRLLRRIRRRAEDLPEQFRAKIVMLSYGMLVSLVTLLACCVTISLQYVEFLWWMFILPVCLSRVVDNIEAGHRPLLAANSEVVPDRHRVAARGVHSTGPSRPRQPVHEGSEHG